MEKSVVGTKKKMDDNGVSMTTVTADYKQFGFNDEQEKAKKKITKTLLCLKDISTANPAYYVQKKRNLSNNGGDECYYYFILTIVVGRFHKFKGFHK